MKKTLITLLMFSSLGIFAQKTEKTKIDFEIEMFPLDIISKEKKFDVLIEYDYASKAEAANTEVADKKSAAAKEKEEYDKKSFGEKLGKKVLLNESKPSGNYFNQTFIPTLFPVEGVKGSINIPGYMKATGAKGTVNVRVFELSYTLDVTQTKITYYPLKMVLTITNDKGMLTYQGDLPNNSAVMTYTAATSSAIGNSYLSILNGIETGAKNAAITNLNSYLKTNYGFNTLKDERPFFDVKDKKQSYPEYHEAFEKVKNAFVYCNMPGKQDAMTAKLKEAISIW